MESNKMIIAVDLKKFRIRIHKTTLRRLGKPERVQLLFNPEKRALLISCPTKTMAESQDEKVLFDKPGPDGSCQLYSRLLIRRMQEVCPNLETNGLYHVEGRYIRNMNAGYFLMDECIKMDDGEEATV